MSLSFESVLRTKQVYWAIACLGLIIHLGFAKEIFAVHDRLLAWALLLIFLRTAYSFFLFGQRRVPILPMVSLQFYVIYGLSQLVQDSVRLVSGTYVPSERAVTIAMAIVVGGELLFLLGARAGEAAADFAGFAFSRFYPDPRELWSNGVLIWALLGGVNFFILNIRSDLIPIGIRHVVHAVLHPELALILLFFCGFRTGSRQLLTVAYVLVATMSAFGLLSAMMENMVLPIFVLFLGSWLWGPGMRVRWFVVALAVFLVFNPVKYRYRIYVAEAGPVGSVSGIRDRIDVWKEAIVHTWQDPFALEETTQVTTARTSFLISLAQGVDWVPSVVPYKRGEGLSTAALFFIPRIVWPDKPDVSDLVNNRYAVEFEYTTKQGTETSTIGTYQPLDGYWDFGVAGALGYLLITGLTMGFAFGAGRRRGDVDTVLAFVFMVSFFQTLQGFQNMVASVFTMFVGAFIALQILKQASNFALGERRGIERAAPTP